MLKQKKFDLENFLFSLIFFSSIFISQNSFAADSLSYSGRLVKADGAPVAGPVDLTVDLAYTNAPGTILCSQSFNDVVLSNGVFHLKLDLVCPGPPVKTLTEILSAVPATFAAALRVTDVDNSKVYAFQALHAMPFANIAETSKQLVQLGAANGQVLKWNDTTKKWEPGTPGGGGTVTNLTVTSPLAVLNGTTTPALSIAQSSATVDGYLSAADWSTFNAKIGLAAGGTITQFYRGDKSWQTLNTDAVPDAGMTNLYFTNARALGVPLGASLDVVSLAGDITSADTILTAFGRTQKQLSALNSSSSNFLIKNTTDSVTGQVTINATTGSLLLPRTPSDAELTAAANVNYVKTYADTKLPLSGGTLTNDLTLNTQARFKGGANYVELKANAALPATISLTLPMTVGANGDVLSSNGAGVLSWVNPSSLPAGSGTVNSSSITDDSIVNADINSAAAIDQSKIAGLTAALAAKEPTIAAGTAAQYYAGDKTWQTLNTSIVPELTNLYFTEPRVRSALLTGVNTALAGTIDGTDSVLGGFGKTQKQLTDIATGVTANQWTAATGNVYRASGNVGIGTITPSSLLEVAGANSTADLRLTRSNNVGAASEMGTITFRAPNASGTAVTWAQERVIVESAVAGTEKASLAFNTQNSGSLVERMRIDSSGNVGIGASPTAVTNYSVLDIQGKTVATGGLISLRTSDSSVIGRMYSADGYYLDTTTNSPIILKTNNVERMRILSAGNVGIGTSTPTASLQLKAGTAALNTAPLKFTSGVNLTTPEAGAIEYDGTNLYFTDNTNTRKTLGVTGAGIATLGGLSGTSQTFATGTAGTAPAFNSATTIHTLNIPMAATAAVTAGLISKAEYDSFSAKQAAFTTSAALLGILTDETGSGSAVFSASPTFTGVPLAPTAAVDTNTTQIATTAFVLGQASAVAPLMNGVAAVGTSLRYTRQDHVHPTDTSRAPAAGSASITTLGTITSGTWNGAVVDVPYGGTGKATLGLNKLLYGNGTAAVNELALPASLTTTSLLLSTITTGAPAWTTSTSGNVLKGSLTGVAFGPLDATDLPAGTLSGSGTAGYIPYYSAASTLANSPMTVSGSNIGIGTASPSGTLHVAAASASSIINSTTNGNYSNLIISGKDSGGTARQTNFTFKPGTGTSSSLGIYNDILNILETGNVGIGTTTPGAKLGIATAVDGMPATSGTVDSNVAFRINSNTNSQLDFGSSSVTNLSWMQSRSAANFATKYPLALNPNGGNVGIGTTAPTRALHIVSGATWNNTAGAHVIVETADTIGAGITLKPSSSTQPNGWALYAGSTTAAVGNGSIGFWNHTNSSVPFMINQTGNVGIGTSAPTANLHISTLQSGAASPTVLKLDAWNGTATSQTSIVSYGASTGWMALRTGGTDRINIDNAGNVGIASATPSEKLEVVGNIKATAYLYTSDKRLKKNIETIDDSLDKILRLRGVEFDWKKSGAHEIGLIAQEVEEVEPELVETSSVDGMKSVKYGNIVAILIEAMKVEHQQVEENKKLISLMSNGLEKVDHRVRKMEREIASLKDENKKLKDDIQSIKKHLKIK